MILGIKKHKNLIPLVLMGIACIYTIFNYLFNRRESDGELITYVLSYKNYLAFFAVGLNFLIYFLLRKHFKKVIVITVVVGILGFLKYLPVNILLNFGISIEVFSCFIGLLYFVINYQTLFKQKANEAELPDFDKILSFKGKYAHKEEEELLEIAAELLKKIKS